MSSQGEVMEAKVDTVKEARNVAVGLEGFHDEKNLLFIIDEVSYIPDSVYDTIEKVLSGGARCILTNSVKR